MKYAFKQQDHNFQTLTIHKQFALKLLNFCLQPCAQTRICCKFSFATVILTTKQSKDVRLESAFGHSLGDSFESHLDAFQAKSHDFILGAAIEDTLD